MLAGQGPMILVLCGAGLVRSPGIRTLEEVTGKVGRYQMSKISTRNRDPEPGHIRAGWVQGRRGRGAASTLPVTLINIDDGRRNKRRRAGESCTLGTHHSH